MSNVTKNIKRKKKITLALNFVGEQDSFVIMCLLHGN